MKPNRIICHWDCGVFSKTYLDGDSNKAWENSILTRCLPIMAISGANPADGQEFGVSQCGGRKSESCRFRSDFQRQHALKMILALLAFGLVFSLFLLLYFMRTNGPSFSQLLC